MFAVVTHDGEQTVETEGNAAAHIAEIQAILVAHQENASCSIVVSPRPSLQRGASWSSRLPAWEEASLPRACACPKYWSESEDRNALRNRAVDGCRAGGMSR